MNTIGRALALGIMLPTAAVADSQQVLNEYGDALSLFGAGKAKREDYYSGAPAQVLADIEGNWTDLYQMQVAEPNADTIAKSCTNALWKIQSPDKFGFSMVRLGRNNKTYTVSYVNNGGNSFVFTSNIMELSAFTGVNPVDSYAMSRLVAGGSGLAMVYRPSPDILVITSFGNPPAIYSRCP